MKAWTFRLTMLAILALAAASYVVVRSVDRGFAAVRLRENDMGTMTTNWNSAVGAQTYVTQRNVGENDTEHAKRHKRGVDAMQIEFPKI